jgi:RNA recognition motif-containing protein
MTLRFTQLFRESASHVYIGQPPSMLGSAGDHSAECSIVIRGLPWFLSDPALRKECESCGSVRSVVMVPQDHLTKKFSGVAIVEYLAADAVKSALQNLMGLLGKLCAEITYK